MPRINDQYLDSAIYLYPSVQAAEKGEAAGGSGVLVAVPAQRLPVDMLFTYAVTNSHVVREGKSTVVRVNSASGGLTIKNIPGESWLHHPDGDDVAVAVWGENRDVKIKVVRTTQFMSRDILAAEEIGPGDDVVVVGRLVTHEGRQRNTPVARFGHIAMMPYETIRTRRGHDQESFLVESRSISGFSGSPVFIIRNPGSWRPGTNVLSDRYVWWLLGIDWGHLNNKHNRDSVVDATDRQIGEVASNTGFMCVVPAWRILDLLNHPTLVDGRERNEDLWLKYNPQPAKPS
jgi:hypothetical protein